MGSEALDEGFAMCILRPPHEEESVLWHRPTSSCGAFSGIQLVDQ